jgi:hypothetical protein
LNLLGYGYICDYNCSLTAGCPDHLDRTPAIILAYVYYGDPRALLGKP